MQPENPLPDGYRQNTGGLDTH